MQDTKTAVQFRWAIRSDLEKLLSIEAACSGVTAWTEDDFLGELKRKNVISMVAEENTEIVGFMLYELQKKRLQVINFAVSPRQQRRGIGSRMIDKLIDKLCVGRRTKICFTVRESNLSAQLFLRSVGFRCGKPVRGYYPEPFAEAAYPFVYTLRDVDDVWCPANRVKEFM